MPSSRRETNVHSDGDGLDELREAGVTRNRLQDIRAVSEYLVKYRAQKYATMQMNDGIEIHERATSSLPISEMGALSKLLDMPVDIFCEISSHLEPFDVLNLARSTRELNTFLMSRESRSIWRVARMYYSGLPDCPPDLSEPAYARLLFETDSCHECLEPRKTKPYYVLRTRLCYVCWTSSIVKGYHVLKIFPDIIEEMLACVPCNISQWSTFRALAQEEYYIGRVKAMLSKFKSNCAQQLQLPDPSHNLWWSTRREFAKHNTVAMDAIVKHSAQMEQWLVTYRQIKLMEVQAAVSRHKSMLIRKLTARGYSAEDFPGDWDTEWEDIMDIPRALTSESFASVMVVLENCIRREKERREADGRDIRRAMRENEIISYTSMLKIPSWMNRADILLLPSVEEIMRKNEYARPILKADWDTELQRIRCDIESAEIKIHNTLISMVKHQDSPMAETTYNAQQNTETSRYYVSLLHSPTTFFKCTCCSDSLVRYPALLTHNMYRSTQLFVKERITYDAEASVMADAILRSLQLAAGEDVADGVFFQCLRCSETSNDPFAWNELIQHFLTRRGSPRGPNLKPWLSAYESVDEDHEMYMFSDNPPVSTLSPEQAVALRGRVKAWRRGWEPVDGQNQ